MPVDTKAVPSDQEAVLVVTAPIEKLGTWLRMGRG